MFTPIDQKKLNKIFKKFADREVETTYQQMCNFPKRLVIAPSDKAIAELKSALEEMGLKLRIRSIGDVPLMGDAQARPDRVNIGVVQDFTDGKYKISKSYTIG
jgi:hypothetical protein